MPQFLRNSQDEVLELPRGVFISGFERPIALTMVRGGLGTELLRRRREPARGTLEGTLTGASYSASQARLDDILAFLHHQPLRYYRSALSDPYFELYTEGLADTDTPIGKATRFRVPLIAPDPLRFGDPQGYPGGANYQDVSEDTYAFAITNVGNAPAPLTAYVQAPAGGAAHLPMIENLTTGQSARYNFGLFDGQELVVDGRAHAATLVAGSEESNVTDFMSNAFLVGGLHLAPGENSLRVTVAVPGVRFRLAYTARYY